MVGPRVLSGDHDEIRGGDVFDGHRPLAHTDGLDQRGARGLVTHVGAVRQVVRPETADQQLIEERGLVAGASRGVEQRLVGAGQSLQVRCDDVVGLVPTDRAVVVLARPKHHRLGQSALLGQPVFGAGRQLRQRVRGEEFRADHPAGGLLGDGLRAVLAELDGFSGAGLLRPGASGAVESIGLIDLRQRGHGPDGTHLGEAVLERHQDTGHTGRRCCGALDPDLVHGSQSRPRAVTDVSTILMMRIAPVTPT